MQKERSLRTKRQIRKLKVKNEFLSWPNMALTKIRDKSKLVSHFRETKPYREGEKREREKKKRKRKRKEGIKQAKIKRYGTLDFVWN